jgi:hypothetical protein
MGLSSYTCNILYTNNLLCTQVPFQIYGSIKSTHAKQGGPPVVITQVHIGGFPYLSFRNDEVTHDFVTYMQIHVDFMGQARNVLSKAIVKFNTKKPKPKEGEEEVEEEPYFDLMTIGAYPLACDSLTSGFTVWGLPKLPIYLNFEPEFIPDINCNFDYWIVEAGGPNGIPELTKACLRFFMVSTTLDDAQQMHWDHFLLDNRLANPSLVLQKYYGDKADPMSALLVAGYLRTWWKSLVADFKNERANGGTVQHMADKFARHLKSVVLHHQSSVECNSFRSSRIIQGMQIVNKLEWDTISNAGRLVAFVIFVVVLVY